MRICDSLKSYCAVERIKDKQSRLSYSQDKDVLEYLGDGLECRFYKVLTIA